MILFAVFLSHKLFFLKTFLCEFQFGADIGPNFYTFAMVGRGTAAFIYACVTPVFVVTLLRFLEV